MGCPGEAIGREVTVDTLSLPSGSLSGLSREQVYCKRRGQRNAPPPGEGQGRAGLTLLPPQAPGNNCVPCSPIIFLQIFTRWSEVSLRILRNPVQRTPWEMLGNGAEYPGTIWQHGLSHPDIYHRNLIRALARILTGASRSSLATPSNKSCITHFLGVNMPPPLSTFLRIRFHIYIFMTFLKKNRSAV